MARAIFLLSAGLIAAALSIGYISYRYSFRIMEKSYQSFYLNKAQMIIEAANLSAAKSDKEYLQALDRYWLAAGNKPADEYLCVVDKNSNLLLHTANPETVGDYAGNNPILKNGGAFPHKKLCDLVGAQKDYTGQYISSNGSDQIAAFIPITEKKWMLGVHRSRNAFYQEIEDRFRPLQVGFLFVCGILMPVSLFLSFMIYRLSQKKQFAFEQALEESEQRYQSLVDTMPQCLCRTDLKGGLIFANSALLSFLGKSLDQCLGRMPQEIYPDPFCRQYLADDVEVISTGQTSDVVREFRSWDQGETTYLEMVRHPVSNGQGSIEGVQCIFWDVTDKRLAEEDLKHTKAQLETVLHSVPSGIVAVDNQGCFTIINPKAEEVLGFTQEKAQGAPVQDFIPDTGLLEVLNTGRLELGKPFAWKNKSLLVSRSPILERGELVGAVSIFQDESELESVQKQLEELQRLNDEMSSLIQNSHDGVLITDTEKVVTVNPSFGRITGLAPSSIEGKDIIGLDAEHHVCLAVVQAVFRHVKSHRSPLTIRRRLQIGNEIFVTGNPVLDKYGQVVRVVMNIRDVTELKFIEEQIKRLSLACLDTEAKALDSPQAALGIVAESPAMKNVLDLAVRVAQVDSTILLSGESGVGKDLIAKLIHKLSRRHDKPFVSINCGAIPENLLESELFGYEKGAFSGADRYGKRGLFEEAADGIVFLDEIGELPLNLQVKLLKIIQEQRSRRLGSVKTVELDIRIMAATNRNLKEMVAANQFREDLFYRLYVVPIEIPPLRERREDILPLALKFLKTCNKKYEVSRTLGQELLRVMENARWPGNVRELQNVVERLVVTAESNVLEPRHLPDSMLPESEQKPSLSARWLGGGSNLQKAKEELERELIQMALAQTKNTREAANLLGVDHSTVVRKARKLGLPIKGEAILH
ncbi:MAG: sigma 54-interacting transcriptional regulator [Desulfobaccales bacterium]